MIKASHDLPIITRLANQKLIDDFLQDAYLKNEKLLTLSRFQNKYTRLVAGYFLVSWILNSVTAAVKKQQVNKKWFDN